MTAISTNDLIISYQLRLLIFFVIYIPPMLFINYKLFTIASKSRRETFTIASKSRRDNEISLEVKKSFSFKSVSSSLLVVACLMSTYILLRAYAPFTSRHHFAPFRYLKLVVQSRTVFYYKQIHILQTISTLKYLQICIILNLPTVSI